MTKEQAQWLIDADLYPVEIGDALQALADGRTACVSREDLDLMGQYRAERNDLQSKLNHANDEIESLRALLAARVLTEDECRAAFEAWWETTTMSRSASSWEIECAKAAYIACARAMGAVR